MAGMIGQYSTKGTDIPTRYVTDFLRGMDRRCRAARDQRDLFSALVEECGGISGLELTELETIRRFAHVCRCVRRIERAEICGEPIDQPTLNDSLRCWLGLLRQFQVIKAKRTGGQDLARAFADEQDRS